MVKKLNKVKNFELFESNRGLWKKEVIFIVQLNRSICVDPYFSGILLNTKKKVNDIFKIHYIFFLNVKVL